MDEQRPFSQLFDFNRLKFQVVCIILLQTLSILTSIYFFYISVKLKSQTNYRHASHSWALLISVGKCAQFDLWKFMFMKLQRCFGYSLRCVSFGAERILNEPIVGMGVVAVVVATLFFSSRSCSSSSSGSSRRSLRLN